MQVGERSSIDRKGCIGRKRRVKKERERRMGMGEAERKGNGKRTGQLQNSQSVRCQSLRAIFLEHWSQLVVGPTYTLVVGAEE